LSKIIKAFQMTQVRSFDFQEIERFAGPSTSNGADTEGEAPSMTEPNSLQDLENTIQKRLAEAKRKAQEMEQEGYRKGYDQGHREGLEAGLETMADTKERLDQLFSQLQELPIKVFRDYRDWFTSTVLAVARQIVGAELSCRPGKLMELIESLLAEAEKNHNFTLYLNPKDLEAIEKYTERINQLKDSVGSLLIKGDPTLLQGGCRLESDMQLLDASIESQFAMIGEMLLSQGVPGELETAR